MKVIIPLAGKGSRMRPHTHTKAKPLLPVAGKPVLDHVIDRFKGLDVEEYIFITGHLKEQIEEHIRSTYTFPARFIEQKVKDGTAGALKLAEPFIDGPMLICFVDTIFDADLSIIKTSEHDGIIWAQEVEDYQRFGVIVHDKGVITTIVEKPTEPISKLANIGLYYIKNHTLFYKGIRHVYEKDLKVKGEYFLPEAFMHMIRLGAKLHVAAVQGWYDCGKPETTLASNAVLLQRRHEVLSKLRETNVIEPVFIDKECEIDGCTIGPNVSVARGCTLSGATVSDSILDENSSVKDITLSESILGRDTYIEGRKEQRLTVLLGDHSQTRLR